jgi:hypothetical protein
MNKNQASDEVNRSLFINITVVLVFVSLTWSFVFYLNKDTTNLRRVAFDNLTEQFSSNVSSSHWQWQSEGRPRMMMLISHKNRLNKNKRLVETDRKPIFMSPLGWPKAEPTLKGCADIWKMMLNTPMDIEGFKITAKYYDGLTLTNKALNSVCRYQLSTGPYFEYKIFLGQVSKVKQ